MKRNPSPDLIAFLFAVVALVLVSVVSRGDDIVPAWGLYGTDGAHWKTMTGVEGGIPDSSAMTVSAIVEPGGGDDTTALQNAIDACNSNQVVIVSNGMLQISSTIEFDGANDSGVVLRGQAAGDGLDFSSGRINIRQSSSHSPYNTDADLAADGVKGATNISVDPIPNWCVPGRIIGIDQFDGGIIATNIGQETAGPLRPTESGVVRGIAMTTRVLATNGTTIHIEMPLVYPFQTSLTAQVFGTATAVHIERVGLENLLITSSYSSSGANLINMQRAANCWIKDCSLTNGPGGPLVWTSQSYRNAFEGNYVGYSHQYDSGDGYGIALYHTSSGNRIVNNIFEHLHVGMQANYGSWGNVFADNYTRYKYANSVGYTSGGGQGSGMSFHGDVAGMNLVEGNWIGSKIRSDYTHGSGGTHNLYFRNRVIGTNNILEQADYFEPVAITIEAFNRSNLVVGNVLGTTWHTNRMHEANTVGPDIDGERDVIRSGYWSTYDHAIVKGNGNDAVDYDDSATMATFWAVNYDVVTSTNSGVVYDGDFTESDLADSFAHSSKPDYYGFLSWPPNGVTAGDWYVTNNPAGYRYVNGTNPPPAEVTPGTTSPGRMGGGIRRLFSNLIDE